MEPLRVSSVVHSRLTWDYEDRIPRVRALYERGKAAQWNAASDIDWSIPVGFGQELPDDSAMGLDAFARSPLAARGRRAWDDFRWQFQAYMVSQFLHGEQGALVATARLVEQLPDVDSKFFAAGQVADEARHVEAFSRYLAEHISDPYPIAGALAGLLTDLLTDKRWDITALGMQIMVEALAMAAFRMAHATFHDPLIKKITELVARDEARHVSFGILALQGIYREMTDAERAEREEFVLEAAAGLRQRFLLGDVWERMEVPADEGREFALTNDMMTAYRKTVFAKVVSSLGHIGLATPVVLHGLDQLGLLGHVPRRATTTPEG